MSKAMVVSNGEIVQVTCISCRRVVRTVAPYGVIGDEGLARMGWSVSEKGKPVCDECSPEAVEEAHGSYPAIEAILNSPLPSPAESSLMETEAYNLETIHRTLALADELRLAGVITHAEVVRIISDMQILFDGLRARAEGSN